MVGWGGLAAIVATGHIDPSAGFGIGLGWAVFVLGMRHAFDADHIAAIDNTTRSLVGAGGRPLSVGFWFSLGHSTVVFAACAVLAGGVRALATTITDDSDTLRTAFGTVGMSVSAVFLLILGVLNLVALVGLVSLARRRGEVDSGDLDKHLNRRGLITRLLGGRLARIAKPWQIYPVGLLFGIGFDTATEVGLFAIAGGAATLALPWYAVLTLPVIFAAGMALFDTLDGLLVGYTYSWASGDSARRRLGFNIVVTGLSVVLALVIGTVEAASVLSERLGWTTGVAGTIGAIDLDYLGYVAVAAFITAWIVLLVLVRRSPKLESADHR